MQWIDSATKEFREKLTISSIELISHVQEADSVQIVIAGNETINCFRNGRLRRVSSWRNSYE